RLLVSYGRAALLASPLVWVTTELGRTYLFTGFPWVLLGYSQTPVLPVAQLASLFGVYGVSGLVAGVSAALAFAAVSPPAATPSAGRYRIPARWTPIAVMFASIVGIAIWGSVRVGRGDLTRTGDAVRVGLIQGNVEQPDKWEPVRAAMIFQD